MTFLFPLRMGKWGPFLNSFVCKMPQSARGRTCIINDQYRKRHCEQLLEPCEVDPLLDFSRYGTRLTVTVTVHSWEFTRNHKLPEEVCSRRCEWVDHHQLHVEYLQSFWVQGMRSKPSKGIWWTDDWRSTPPHVCDIIRSASLLLLLRYLWQSAPCIERLKRRSLPFL